MKEGVMKDCKDCANYASVIDDTLRLAEALNEGAVNGAGFVEHWGERVLQAVEPLRHVKSFPDQVLKHNRVLLEANSENIEALTAAREEIARLKAHNLECLRSYAEYTDMERRVCELSNALDRERGARCSGCEEEGEDCHDGCACNLRWRREQGGRQEGLNHD